MKVLIIGASGQLGTDLCKVYADEDLHTADLLDAHHKVDITRRDKVEDLIAKKLNPDLVINCAAYHNVPKCQDETEKAFSVNATASMYLGAACQEAGARIMHVSTDYVYGLGGKKPYVESDPPAPLSIYGASKLAGEFLIAAECPNHIIVRTSAIYGTAPCRAKGGDNFVEIMLRLAKEKGEVKVVTDEFVSPTYTFALAKQMKHMAEKGEPGLYHATCNEQCSWFDFASAIFEETGTEVNLMPTTVDEFPTPVKRPDYSVLQNKHLQDQDLDIMPDWREGLKAYLEERNG